MAVKFSQFNVGTTISDIDISDITNNSAVITWNTNHASTSKVNFGTDTTFEHSEYLQTPTREHNITIKDLPSNTDIYFEVISEGRTTVYDAYRVFRAQ